MIKCIALDRIKEPKTNKIVSYILKDNQEKTIEMSAQELKIRIRRKEIEVDNLTLTSDGRLVESKNKPLKTLKKINIKIAPQQPIDTQTEIPKQENNENSNEIKVVYNTEKNGIELYFTKKPSNEVLEKIKNANFRWSGFKKCWYIKDSEGARNFVKALTNGQVAETPQSQKYISKQQPDNIPTLKIGGERTESDGFVGYNYREYCNKDITEVAKVIKAELMRVFPNSKWSVTVERYSGGRSLHVHLMSTPEKIIRTKEELKEIYETNKFSIQDRFRHLIRPTDNGEMTFDRFYEILNIEKNTIYSSSPRHEYYINDKGQEIFKYAEDLTESFNRNNSDSYTDYYDVNFYSFIYLGKYDKPFVQI